MLLALTIRGSRSWHTRSERALCPFNYPLLFPGFPLDPLPLYGFDLIMLKRVTARQTELEIVTLESLVPADHLPRKVDAAIDFSFVRDLTERHQTATGPHIKKIAMVMDQTATPSPA